MNERDVVVTITGTVGRGSARPITSSWQVTARADEDKEEVGKAITLACRNLCSELKEAAR